MLKDLDSVLIRFGLTSKIIRSKYDSLTHEVTEHIVYWDKLDLPS